MTTTKSRKDKEQFRAFKAWHGVMHGIEPAEADKQSFIKGESSILFSNLVLLENHVTKKEVKQLLSAKNDQQEDAEKRELIKKLLGYPCST
jgi:hypothetical protein